MKRNKKGFTIVELVIVIGVIGILSAILIPTFVSLTSKAQDAAAKAECASAYTAYSAVALDGNIDAKELEDMGLSGASVAITYKGQDEVALKRGDTFYEWAGEAGNKEWKVYEGSDPTVLVSTDVAHSTFNGCVVYVK